jgi:tetratricopeptide (TPR) repeat protein
MKCLLIPLLAVVLGLGNAVTAQVATEEPGIVYVGLQLDDEDASSTEFIRMLRNSIASENLPIEFVDFESELPVVARISLENSRDTEIHIRIWLYDSPLDEISPFLSGYTNIPITMRFLDSEWYSLVLGIILYAGNRCDLALQPLDDASIDDFYVDAYIVHLFFQGSCALVEGKSMEEIGERLDRAVYLQQMWRVLIVPDAFINWAWVTLQEGETDEAIETLTWLVEHERTSSTESYIYALTKRSQLYALAFRYDEAIADVNAAIELEPDNPELYVERGQRILLTYEWDDVLADYNHALELDPNYAPTYFHRGVLFYTQGPRENALPDFQRYLELAPDGEFAEQAAQYIEEIEAELEALDG